MLAHGLTRFSDSVWWLAHLLGRLRSLITTCASTGSRVGLLLNDSMSIADSIRVRAVQGERMIGSYERQFVAIVHAAWALRQLMGP